MTLPARKSSLSPEKRQQARDRARQFIESLRGPSLGRSRIGQDCHCTDEALITPANIPDARSVDELDPPARTLSDVAERERQLIEELRQRELASRLEGGREYDVVQVECLDHPQWGKLSVASMARRLEVAPGALLACAKSCKRIRSFRVVIAGEEWNPVPVVKKPKAGVKVVCIEHPEWGEFASTSLAARHAKVGRTAIVEAIKSGNTCRGLHWRKVGDKSWKPKPPRDRPVYDSAEDRVYRSIHHAARSMARKDCIFRPPNKAEVKRWNKRIHDDLKKKKGRWRCVEQEVVTAA